MPKGDPAGYLPNVQAARKGGKGKEMKKEMKKHMKGKNPFAAAMMKK